MGRIVHVLWSPQTGPIVGYWDPTKAWQHANTMLGVNLTAIDVRDQIPDIVREDAISEYDGDDDTPRVVDVRIDDIPDREDDDT